MNTFFKLQLKCCPLIWMCCNRSLNNSTNWLDKWYLRIKKNQISKKFSKEMVLSLYIIKTSNVKIFKLISPQIVKEIFSFRDALSYPSRKQTDFQIWSVQCFQWHTKFEISLTKNMENFTSLDKTTWDS